MISPIIFLIITNKNRRVYFGASNYQDFTQNKDILKQHSYIFVIEDEKIGMTLILSDIGRLNSFGVILQRKKHTKI